MSFKKIVLNLGIFIFFIVFSSCAKKEDSLNGAVHLKTTQIRQLNAAPHENDFVKNNSFHATKHPNIYFIFYDTLRPDYALQYKNMRSFFEKNFSFMNAYAAGTSTVYSTFSLFHSIPAFLTYHAISRTLDTHEYGSIFMKILHKLGYKMDIYGVFWNCIPREAHTGTGWDRFLISFFGWKTNLLDRCQTDLTYDAKFVSNLDEVTVSELRTKLPLTVTTPEGHFSMLTFYNNHSPYKWGSLTHGALTDVGKKEDFKNSAHIINRYTNSVAASDVVFQEVMSILDTLPGHKDAIIVLFSDHGEMLYEKGGETTHGGIAYQEKINTLLSFKFGENSSHSKDIHKNSLASISDIFPTVFDYMNVTPHIPKDWITGQSLLSTERKSALIVKSNMENPTRDMVLVNKDKKVWITINESDFYSSNSFHLLKVTHLDDGQPMIGTDACNNISKEECYRFLEEAFPEAMNALYPGGSNSTLLRSSGASDLGRIPAQIQIRKKNNFLAP